MDKMRKVILLLFLLTYGIVSRGQSASPFFCEISFLQSYGFESLNISYRFLNFPSSEKVYYTLGGGYGTEAIVGARISPHWAVVVGANNQIVYHRKRERFLGERNMSRVVFNKNIFSAGIRYTFNFNYEKVAATGLSLQACWDYYLPMELRRVQNNEMMKTLKFPSTQGFNGAAQLFFPIFPNKNFLFTVGLNYRYVYYQGDKSQLLSTQSGNRIDGSGIDVKIGINASF